MAAGRGPRRFSEPAAGLPGIGSSVLTTRLKELEQSGHVVRRTLPPPAASVPYELTDLRRGVWAPTAAPIRQAIGVGAAHGEQHRHASAAPASARSASSSPKNPWIYGYPTH